MKIRSDIRAGIDALGQCQKERDYWKGQAEKMEAIAKGPGPYKPPVVYPQPIPQPQPQPVNPGYGGGWVGGVWYGDRSGWCG